MPGSAGEDMQSCKMLSCSFRGVSSIAREDNVGLGEDFNNLALASRMTVLLLTEGPGLQPSPLGALSCITYR